MSDSDRNIGSSVADLPLNFQLITAAILIFIFSISLWSITGSYGFGFSTRIEILGVSISAILTLGLLYVYGFIANIQQEQTGIERDQIQLQETQNELQKSVIDLQESQQKYIEAAHKPVIQIKSWFLNGDDDDIFLELKNKGNGLAKNLTVTAKIGAFRPTPDGQLYTDINTLLSGMGPNGIHPYPSPVSKENTFKNGDSGAIVKPKNEDEDPDLFIAEIQFQRNKFKSNKEGVVTAGTIPFSEVYQKVNDQDELLIQLELSYEDVVGDETIEEFYSATIEPQDEETLEQVIDSPQ